MTIVARSSLLRTLDADLHEPFNRMAAERFTVTAVRSVVGADQDAGHDVATALQRYGDVAYGWAVEDTTGLVKLVADRTTGRLLGAHYMGPQASTLVQQMITVMAVALDLREVATQQHWIHPAPPEVTENALLDLDLA